MANDITRDLKLRLDTKDAANALGLLELSTKKAEKAVKDLEQAGQKGTEEWKKSKIALDEARKSQDAQQKSMKLTEMSYTQLTNFVNKMEKAVRNEVNTESAAGKEKIKIWQAALAEQAKQKNMMDEIRAKATELGKPTVWNGIKSSIANAFAITSVDRIVGAIINFGKEAVLNAANASDAFGGIKKAIDGITMEEIVELNKEIAKIDTRTAQSELLKIAQIGGQIGVTKEEMLGFVKSVDMAVVALGDEFAGGAEEVSSKLGTLSKIFRETKDLKAGEAISKIGSAINELGAAGSATGPVIVDFATRMGALGNLSPQISQTLGLGAAFQELGLSGEIAASGLKNILNGAATATKLYADQIGYTEAEFKKLINSSPNDVILKLAASFKGLPTTEVARQMDALGIKSNEAKSVMSLLANQTERVTTLQGLSAKAMIENTSLTKEFNTMNTTAAAELEKAGKVVTQFAMMIGTYLLPVLTLLTTGFISMGMAVMKIPAFIKENQTAFTALGVAIVALNGNNIRAAASTIAHSAAETARTIVTKASAIAQELQLRALILMEAATKKQTTASYASIVAEKIRVTTANLVTSAKTTLRAITAALTLENIKNTASSTAQAIAEKARALVTNTVTGAQTLLKTVTTALTLENIRATASAAAHTVVEKARTIATNAVAIAQGLLNAVMRANPIGVVITLAAALVAGFMKLYDNSQTLRAGMSGLWNAVKTVGTVIADVWSAITSLDFGKVATIIGNAGTSIAKAFTDGYHAKIKEEAPKVVAVHEDMLEKQAAATRKATLKALAESKDTVNNMLKTVDDAYRVSIEKRMVHANLKQLEAIKTEVSNHISGQGTIDEKQDKIDKQRADKKQKQLEKETRDKEKQLEDFHKAEEKYAEKIRTDREKALELAAQMEAENEQAMAETSLQVEESKIREKARKRKKDIQDSTIDAELKVKLTEQIEENSRLAIERKQEEYRVKKLKKDEEAARKKQEIEGFIRDQEQIAEMMLLDWKEVQAKGNATKLVAIKKERLDTELRFLQQNLQAEMEAEKAKARTMELSGEQLATTLSQIDERYRIEGLLAVNKNTQDKLAVDKEYHDRKVANIKAFSDVFKGVLNGDLSTLINSAAEMFAVSKKGDEDRAASFIEKAEKVAAFAKGAVDFLNKLAQDRATKAIELAKREMEEKVAILQQEIAVTDSLIQSSSKYITELKEAETARLGELQKIMTSENATEEEKRDAAKKYYSEQFQQMKAAEEQKIKDLQRLANLAKTDDEKLAIEEKIKLAKQETAEKIRLGEEQLAKNLAKVDEQIRLEYKLTSETTSEEQKKDMLKEFYSKKLQAMKEAEEAHIQDLQRRANEAKTEDERMAIEAKITMAKKEAAEKIRLAEEEAAKKTETLEGLKEYTTQLSEDTLSEATKHSEKQITIASDEAEQKADFKADLEETIAAENRKARATEQAEKTKAFKAQKKADIATALITGALAVLKALANFFPLNIILAATAAVVTGVQIAKIKNQPDPVFALGGLAPNPSFADGGTLGHVPQGGRHGASYGTGGIQLLDRATGRDVGEMEGGEAIISTRQTEANWPLIQQMFKNARTPGKTDAPVIPHPATPMAFRDGGQFTSPYFERGMYLFGSKKRKAEQAAKDAEAEAARAQAEADAAMADMPSFDSGAYGGIDSSDPSASGDTAGAAAQHEEARKMGKDQLISIQSIEDETIANGQKLGDIVNAVNQLKGSINGVEGAVNSVRDAVYNTNTQGKFDALIGAISSMSA